MDRQGFVSSLCLAMFIEGHPPQEDGAAFTPGGFSVVGEGLYITVDLHGEATVWEGPRVLRAS